MDTTSIAGFIILGLIILIGLIILVRSIKVVRQSEAYVVERLGKYDRTLSNGVNIVVPFLDRIASKISLKEKVADFPPQPVITKDNVTMQIDTVVFYQITDPKLYAYGVERPVDALGNLTATTLRNIVGDLELDETLTSRDIINTKIRSILDEATDPWGIKIRRVELKNIFPPRDIQDSMEKQMRAERERRESILRAEGEKKAAILIAEGEKESTILRAEASKAQSIAHAEGEAQAMLSLFEAQAAGVKLINEAAPSQNYLILKGYETLAKVADGRATKLIIPSNIQDVTSLTSTVAEILKVQKEEE